MYQISAETDNFHILDQTCPKRVFPTDAKNTAIEFHQKAPSKIEKERN